MKKFAANFRADIALEFFSHDATGLGAAQLDLRDLASITG